MQNVLNFFYKYLAVSSHSTEWFTGCAPFTVRPSGQWGLVVPRSRFLRSRCNIICQLLIAPVRSLFSVVDARKKEKAVAGREAVLTVLRSDVTGSSPTQWHRSPVLPGETIRPASSWTIAGCFCSVTPISERVDYRGKENGSPGDKGPVHATSLCCYRCITLPRTFFIRLH